MRNLKPISGWLKRQLHRLGWRQLKGPRPYWNHSAHLYVRPGLEEVTPGRWAQLPGYTLRAAARRAGILPRGY